MISIDKTQSVSDPHRTLTRAQQDAAEAIGYYRRQVRAGNGWLVGEKRISQKLVSDLKRLDVIDEDVIEGRSILRLTTAGKLAVTRRR